MPDARPTMADEIERYIRTGDYDPDHWPWPGTHPERARLAHGDFREGLLREVRRLAGDRAPRRLPTGDLVELTRRKVEPMVRGLFPKTEQEAVLALLERSVVFLTGENIEQILRSTSWHSTAWVLANLYLASVGAGLLGDEAPRIVGLSQATTCYVSPEYFTEDNPFADFIVHEAAHIFHNCQRRTAGLAQTRQREWLLGIDFEKRETFAYSCEAYSRILERAGNPAARRRLAVAFGKDPRIFDERADPAEVADIVREATLARNGWKVILDRCAQKGL